MTETYATYRSENAPAGQEWLAYIHVGTGRLNMAFFDTSEAAVVEKAKAFWDAERETREANAASREAGRIKVAETRARKASVSGAHKNSEVQ